MAATETRTHDQIIISGIDAADWTASAYLYVDSITFMAGAANDIMVMKERTDAGSIVFYAKSTTDGEPRIQYFEGARMKPMIDHSACTLNAGAQVVINLKGRR
jgi:hypothetical protein